MENKEVEGVHRKLLEAFEAGYPHLTLKVAWQPHTRKIGAWTATVRTKGDERVVAKGIRRDPAKAVEAALESIPEQFQRTPEMNHS